jgi:flagellar biosynthesis anti-sigma factor FlgM
MKIQGTPRATPIPESRAIARHEETRVSRPSTERVSLSSQARQLADARAPEVPDETRIAELRDKLAAGKLHIDFEAIADAMLREER